MKKIKITDELLAAFVEGNTTPQETAAVISAARENPEIRQMLEMSDKIDDEVNPGPSQKKPASIPTGIKVPMPQVEQMPMMAMAANTSNNDCVLACEKYVLRQHNIKADYDNLKLMAKRRGWLRPEGTPLYNIGRLLEEAKLSVARRFDCNLALLRNELEAGCSVIVALDGNELLGDYEQERQRDNTEGRTANHAVVVTAVNEADDYVEIHDPDSKNTIDRYPTKQFIDAWNDAQYYMVSVIERGRRPYKPHPHNIDGVRLPSELDELTEAIAENAHEVWAQKRQQEGWTYGPERNDKLKQSPDMVPYCELTEEEKEYDRATAMRSIKLLYRLGYEIVKKNK